MRCSVLAAPLALAFVVGCGTMTAVRPLRAGESAAALSLGGPVARVAGFDIPLPYVTARYRYGASDRLGLSAGWHVTPAVLGVASFDAAMSYVLLDQRGFLPAAGVAVGVTAHIEPAGPSRLFPNLDLAAAWRYGGRFTSYLGIQSMYQLSREPYAAFAPLVGQAVEFGRFGLGVEAKWYAPTENTEPRQVEYRIPIAGKGAVGFVLGADWRWGGAR
ncbi:MAG: hypothetical protein R6X12_09150 [bacterium]